MAVNLSTQTVSYDIYDVALPEGVDEAAVKARYEAEGAAHEAVERETWGRFFINAPKYNLSPFPEGLHPEAVVVTRGGPPMDYTGCRYASLMVSDRWRALVEEMEPHRHRFAPMRVLAKDGKTLLGTWHAFRPGWAMQAIDPDAGGIELRAGPWRESGEDPCDYQYKHSLGRDQPVPAVKAALVAGPDALTAGRACWVDPSYSYGRPIFWSDAFMARVTEAGMTGWSVVGQRWREV